MPNLNLTYPTDQNLRPKDISEWLGLITSTIGELKGENWYNFTAFTLKQLTQAINNDPNFATTINNALATKLNASDYTATDVLNKLKTVDGSGSGLDADTVRGYVPVNKAGDTMTGFLTLYGDPTQALHAATKQYVDTLMQTFSVKTAVRAATTTNITLSGTQTIDGVALVVGDRVLVKNQTDAEQNGIYVVQSGAWVRANDANTDSKLTNGLIVFVREGTVNGHRGWILTTDNPITVGATPLNFEQFSGAGQITAGTGLTKSGDTLSLANSGVTAGTYTKVTVDVYGRVTSGTTLSASDIPSLDWSKITTGKPTTLSGYGITDAVNVSEVVTSPAPNKILKLDGNSKLPASITGNADGNAATASKLQTARTISLSGDVTGSVSFDGSANVTIATTLANSGVTAGTYTKVTVDAKGRVTSGTTLSASDIPGLDWSKIISGKPTTLAGYGITDAVNISEVVATPQANKILKLDSGGNLPTSITGNAATASKLQTARTITLSGDISGSVSFDGSSDVSISTTLANSGVSAGTYTKVTVDAKGRVTSGTTLSASDIPNLDWSKITTGKPTTLAGYGITDAALANHNHDSVYVKLSGSTMTGPLTLAGDPTQNLHAATKQYVDGLVQGLRRRTAVKVATTGNITLSGLQTIDGISLSNGDRVLVKNQTNAVENGIYVASSGAWTRASDFDDATDLDGAVFVFVEMGSVNADTGWVLSSDDTITIGTSPVTWVQFSSAGVVTGDAVTIVKTGNTLSLKSGVVSPGTYTKLTVDTYGRVTAGTTLSASDIPSLDWSKITTGKPSTLAGYGIIDAVNISEVATSPAPNKILKLDGTGKLPASITGDSASVGGFTPNKILVDRGYAGAADWNTILDPGVYRVGRSSWDGITNPPSSSYPFGTLMVLKSGKSVSQLYLPHNAGEGRGFFVRTKWNANDWGSWEKVWTDRNHGSGSGLDSDLLDGIDSTGFLRRNVDTDTTGKITITRDGDAIVLNKNTTTSYSGITFNSRINTGSDYAYIRYYDDVSNFFAAYDPGGQSNENSALVIGVENDEVNGCNDYLVLRGAAKVIVDAIGDTSSILEPERVIEFRKEGTLVSYIDNTGKYMGDADTLDGLHASAFMRADQPNTSTAGNLSVGGTLTVTGSATLNSGLTIAGGNDLSIGATGANDTGDIIFKNSSGNEKVRLYTANTGNVLFISTSSSPTTNYFAFDSGKLGIGTTNFHPNIKLQVLGGGIVAEESGSVYGMGLLATANASGLVFRKDGVRHAGLKWDGSKLYLLDASTSGSDPNWTVGIPVATYDIVNTRVGIGTASPARRFHIVDTTWDDTTGGGAIFENNSNVGAGITLKPAASSKPNGWALYAGATSAAIGDGSVGFWNHTTNTAPFMINQSGNVGIGTTSPSYRLDVVGDTRISGVVRFGKMTYQVTFSPGETTKTITHNLGTTNYMCTLGANSVARHVAWANKTANTIDIVIDDAYPFGSITVDVILMAY